MKKTPAATKVTTSAQNSADSTELAHQRAGVLAVRQLLMQVRLQRKGG